MACPLNGAAPTCHHLADHLLLVRLALWHSGVQVWIRKRAAEAAARAKFKRELAESKRQEAIEELKLMEAERELQAAEQEVHRLQRELTAPVDAHEDMARQEMQRLLEEHIVMYNAPSDQVRCLTMLRKIATNVLSAPDNAKFRRIKAKNEALSERVLAVRGGRAFLVAMGFVPTVIDFEQHFQLLGLKDKSAQVPPIAPFIHGPPSHAAKQPILLRC